MEITTQVFLGVTIIGIIVSTKIVLDGIRALADLNDKIETLRAATNSCTIQLEVKEGEIRGIETKVAELKTSVDELTKSENEINKEMQTLRAELK